MPDPRAARQAALIRWVHGAARLVERVAARAWRGLSAFFGTFRGYSVDYHHAAAVLRPLPAQLAEATQAALTGVYLRSYRAEGRLLAVEARTAPAGAGLLAGGLLAPPPEPVIRAWLARFVRPENYERIGTDTQKFLPDEIAARIASLLARGKTQQDVAKEIRPLLDGSRVRARRAARTFGLFVAHQAQWDAWEQLGDTVIGYQAHSAKVPESRPWHVARDNVIYYRDPAPGRKGLAQMPRPPLEPHDPAERPAGTPEVAWNCLCFLSPVLSP